MRGASEIELSDSVYIIRLARGAIHGGRPAPVTARSCELVPGRKHPLESPARRHVALFAAAAAVAASDTAVAPTGAAIAR